MDSGGHTDVIFEYFTIVTLSNSSEARIAAGEASVPPQGLEWAPEILVYKICHV